MVDSSSQWTMQRESVKCCLSLSSGCHLIREECCGSSWASVVQAAAHLRRPTHSDLYIFFLPSTLAVALVGDESGGKCRGEDEKMAGVS